jgi:hypothetical protein
MAFSLGNGPHIGKYSAPLRRHEYLIGKINLPPPV